MDNGLFFVSARTGDKTKDKWQTPPEVFEQLNQEFNFTLYVAAEPETALCDHYFTEDDDTLHQSWQKQVVFCNPPYSQLRQFSEKAKREAESGSTVVMLAPARTDTKTFHESLAGGEVRFIKGRLKFQQQGKAQDPAPFPCMVCVMGPDIKSEMKCITLTKG